MRDYVKVNGKYELFVFPRKPNGPRKCCELMDVEGSGFEINVVRACTSVSFRKLLNFYLKIFLVVRTKDPSRFVMPLLFKD